MDECSRVDDGLGVGVKPIIYISIVWAPSYTQLILIATYLILVSIAAMYEIEECKLANYWKTYD